MGENRKVNM
jgi:hypothetical protein